MNTQKRLIIVIGLSLLLLSGCTAQSAPSQPTSTKIIFLTSTPEETPTSIPSAMPTPITPPQLCNNDGVPQTPDSDYGFEGVLVYLDRNTNEYYLAGGKPLKKTKLNVPLFSGNIELVGFSPNGEWLAFVIHPETGTVRSYKGIASDIYLLSYEDEEILFHPTNDPLEDLGVDPSAPYILLPTWINNEVLYVNLYTISEDNSTTYAYPSILNPFSQEWLMEPIHVIDKYNNVGLLEFSQNLSKVAFTEKESYGYIFNLIIYDYLLNTTYEAITDINNFNLTETMVSTTIAGYRTDFEWSPDGSKAAVVEDVEITWITTEWGFHPHQEEMFIFSQNTEGTYSQQTLGIVEGKINLVGTPTDYSDINLNNLTWSKDSRFLAFTLAYISDDLDDKSFFVIFDTFENRFSFQCPTEYHVEKIYWSPDDQQIALLGQYPFQDELFVAIFDLETGDVNKILEGEATYYFSGWSDKFTTAP